MEMPEDKHIESVMKQVLVGDLLQTGRRKHN